VKNGGNKSVARSLYWFKT